MYSKALWLIFAVVSSIKSGNGLNLLRYGGLNGGYGINGNNGRYDVNGINSGYDPNAINGRYGINGINGGFGINREYDGNGGLGIENPFGSEIRSGDRTDANGLNNNHLHVGSSNSLISPTNDLQNVGSTRFNLAPNDRLGGPVVYGSNIENGANYDNGIPRLGNNYMSNIPRLNMNYGNANSRLGLNYDNPLSRLDTNLQVSIPETRSNFGSEISRINQGFDLGIPQLRTGFDNIIPDSGVRFQTGFADSNSNFGPEIRQNENFPSGINNIGLRIGNEVPRIESNYGLGTSKPNNVFENDISRLNNGYNLNSDTGLINNGAGNFPYLLNNQRSNLGLNNLYGLNRNSFGSNLGMENRFTLPEHIHHQDYTVPNSLSSNVDHFRYNNINGNANNGLRSASNDLPLNNFVNLNEQGNLITAGNMNRALKGNSDINNFPVSNLESGSGLNKIDNTRPVRQQLGNTFDEINRNYKLNRMISQNTGSLTSHEVDNDNDNGIDNNNINSMSSPKSNLDSTNINFGEANNGNENKMDFSRSTLEGPNTNSYDNNGYKSNTGLSPSYANNNLNNNDKIEISNGAISNGNENQNPNMYNSNNLDQSKPGFTRKRMNQQYDANGMRTSYLNTPSYYMNNGYGSNEIRTGSNTNREDYNSHILNGFYLSRNELNKNFGNENNLYNPTNSQFSSLNKQKEDTNKLDFRNNYGTQNTMNMNKQTVPNNGLSAQSDQVPNQSIQDQNSLSSNGLNLSQ